MLVTLKQILDLCEARTCAVGSFHTPNLESVMAVIGAAEELQVPVVIQHAEVHEEIMPLEVIGPVMTEAARRAKVPVCVHLDHGESLDYLCRALDLGFTSIMYDGSNLSFEENLANTRMAVSFAGRAGASVEAEIGTMGRRETGSGTPDGEADPGKIYTDPEQAGLFVRESGIDALACSFGTTHGVYLTKPKLDFGVVEQVRRATGGIPVVMHGGSGVSGEEFRRAIQAGVRKINYYTYMAMAGGAGAEAYLESVRESGTRDAVLYHDVAQAAVRAMQENCRAAMQVFTMRS